VNYFLPQVLSSSALISGRGYLFGISRRLRALYSTQSLMDPSFFLTNRIVASAAERDRRTLPVGRFSRK